MKLPKGTFNGLARILTPLTFWMALGWFLFPAMVEKVTVAQGESIDMAEVRIFSNIMVVTCIIIGIILLVYARRTKEPDDAKLERLASIVLCPYCGRRTPKNAGHCSGCGKNIPK